MRPLHTHVTYLPLYLKSEATSCGLRATLFHQQDGVQKIIGHARSLEQVYLVDSACLTFSHKYI